MALFSPTHRIPSRLLSGTLAVHLVACAATSGAKPVASTSESKRVMKLSDALTIQRKRLTELEARLSLLESETRGARSAVLSETVRIGGKRSAEHDFEVKPLADQSTRPTGASSRREPAPVRLQLYGRRKASHVPEQQQAYEAPVVSERLAVAPLPGSLATGQGKRSGRKGLSFKKRYASALQFLQKQQYTHAEAAFAALEEDFPEHRLADNVVYWRAEVAYAMRAYRASARLFELLIARFPRSDKLPQALFKAGLCYRRLGRDEIAEEFLARVKSEFPDSEVARLASAEGSR